MVDWDYKRIAAVDRSLLRVAAAELLYEPTIPPAVTINEAVEIAKKRGKPHVAKVVNGVLRNVVRKGRPDFAAIESGTELLVPISIFDRGGKEVVHAEITTWVSPK